MQQWPVKTGGRLVKHVRYYWLMPAGSPLARRLVKGIGNGPATKKVMAGEVSVECAEG